MKVRDLFWLVGFLEGEGSFFVQNYKYYNPRVKKTYRYRYPRVAVNTTDKDVVQRAATLMSTNLGGPYVPSNGISVKRFYKTCAYGNNAITLMRKLRPHMGCRRQRQIDKVLRRCA